MPGTNEPTMPTAVRTSGDEKPKRALKPATVTAASTSPTIGTSGDTAEASHHTGGAAPRDPPRSTASHRGAAPREPPGDQRHHTGALPPVSPVTRGRRGPRSGDARLHDEE